MAVDPSGHFGILATLLIGALVGSIISASSSIIVQSVTTGIIDWGDVGISSLFGAVGGALAVTGVGGAFGQFFIQGGLAVAESVTTAASNNELSSISVGEEIINFMFNGILGGIGAKSAAVNFRRYSDIGNSLSKVVFRDFSRKGLKTATKTFFLKSKKYFNEMWDYAIKEFFYNIPNIIFSYLMEKAR